MFRTLLLPVLLTALLSSTQSSLIDWSKQMLGSILGIHKEDHEESLPSAAVPDESVPEITQNFFLSTPQVLTKYGYQSERHVVRTEDGFLISLDRIPHGKKQFVPPYLKPVVLFRSLFANSYEYLYLGPQDALAYKLADAGRDVWIVNLRGAFHSQGHVALVPTDPAFWNFSWHEMGVYDVPASLDYVLQETGQEAVYTVGYDMGATALLVALAEEPRYNAKIRLVTLLAPLAYTQHMDGVLGLLGIHLVPEIFGLPSNQPVMPHTTLEALADISGKICALRLPENHPCRNLTKTLQYIYDIKMTMTDVPMTADMSPGMESLKTLIHYMQGANTGKFQQYDYGSPEQNMHKYGSGTPPEYHLRNINAPVIIFSSQDDIFASVKDMEQLREGLPNVVNMWQSKELNHTDFIYNPRAHHQVYKHLIHMMNKF